MSDSPKITITPSFIRIGGRAYPRNMGHTIAGQAIEVTGQHQPAGTLASFLTLYDLVLQALVDAGAPKIGDVGGSRKVRYTLRQA